MTAKKSKKCGVKSAMGWECDEPVGHGPIEAIDKPGPAGTMKILPNDGGTWHSSVGDCFFVRVPSAK